MRLMAGRNYRLIIRHHGWEKDVLNVNLNDYLLLTKMEGHRISPQEYPGPAGRVFYHLLPYTEGMPRLSG